MPLAPLAVLWIGLLLADASAFDEGVRLAEAGKKDEARAYFTAALAKNPESPVPSYWLGRMAFDEGDWNRAIDGFEKAVELDDGSSWYHLWLGRAIGRKAQEASVLKQPFLAKKVRVQFERAVELDPANLEARSDLISYYLMAPGMLGGSVDKAKEQAREIAARDGFAGHMTMARIWEHEKEDGPYEEELKLAVQEKPDAPGPRWQLGLLYARLERWDDAFRAFEELTKDDKLKRNALYQIGRTGALSGRRLEQAARSLETFLAGPAAKDGEPPPAAAHVRLGQVYEKLGRTADARTQFETALRLDPKNDDAKKSLSKLKASRG